MSSKKAERKKRQERERQRRGRKRNPAVLFILAVGVGLALLVGGALLFGDPTSSGPQGDPPYPGAVWSPEHGHWH